MVNGKDYYEFKGNKIDAETAEENYKWWEKKLGIPKTFNKKYMNTLAKVKMTFGAQTCAYKYKDVKNDTMIFPILNIFSYSHEDNSFKPDLDTGLKSLRTRGGKANHMTTAMKEGLDNLVFTYLGMHLPYHRIEDSPPVAPFGFFVEPDKFAYCHGAPCDRDYEKNWEVQQSDLDKYFLQPEDFYKLITHRIFTDELFNKEYFNYFGNCEIWEDENYQKTSWMKKGEICFFEKVHFSKIKAILWPVFEQFYSGEPHKILPNELQSHLEKFFIVFQDINIIFYRPFFDKVNPDNWGKKNQRDFEMALVEASYLAQKYYIENGIFPDSIDDAKEFFNMP